MSRIENPDAANRVSLHVVGICRYASTQPSTLDPVTGKKKHSHVRQEIGTPWLLIVPESEFCSSPPRIRGFAKRR